MNVTFKNSALCLEGRPLFVLAGEAQYFRLPPSQWQDRLEKLAAAGLNAVGTYVVWNFHEPHPGAVDFESPERAVDEFFQTARRLGLYLIARPGPYVCNEWDLGGYPGWLIRPDNNNWRTGAPAHLAACRQWYAQVNPRLANLDGLLLYQVENEHFWGDKDLFEGLCQQARQDGITVPLVTNGGGSVYTVGCQGLTDGIDFYTNVGELWRYKGWFERLRALLPPGSPFLVLEAQGATNTLWGDPPQTEGRLPAPQLLASLGDLTGMGANLISLFVAAGGVNPVDGGSDHITTSYFTNGLVAPWGALNPKFYDFRLFSGFIHSFNEALATALPANQGWGTDCPWVACQTRSGPAGTFHFLHNQADTPQTARLRGRTGAFLPPLSLAPGESFPVPEDVALGDGLVLVFCTGRLARLWRAGTGFACVVYGPEGTEGELQYSRDGRLETLRFVYRHEVSVAALPGVRVYAVTPETARRTWYPTLEGVTVPLFGNLDLLRPGLPLRGELAKGAEAVVLVP
jgi:beta-galactosidase